jgi:dTDP-4-dehydrorhamnose reductase
MPATLLVPPMSTPRRIIIIGRDGQLARALIRQFATVLPDRAAPEITVLARPMIDLLRGPELVTAIEAVKPNLVINAAAYTAVDKAEDEPDLAHAINATAAGAIAKAAARADAPVIHVSTDYVFDGSKRTPYVETDPVSPLGVYGASKLAGEAAVIAANPAHVILRTAWVCSPDGSNFVKTMLRFGAERPVLRVVDDQVGAPTFAADLAQAISTIAGVLAQSGPDRSGAATHYGIFHLASGGSTSWCGFARAIMAGAVVRGQGPMAVVEAITTAEYPTKAKRPAYSKLATVKIATAYGIVMPDWQPSLDVCLDALIGPTRSGH